MSHNLKPWYLGLRALQQRESKCNGPKVGRTTPSRGDTTDQGGRRREEEEEEERTPLTPGIMGK